MSTAHDGERASFTALKAVTATFAGAGVGGG
jgi:hypothetical protein